MSEFKDRLWQELMRDHGADLAKMTGRPSKHRRRRPRLLAGTSLGVAGAGAALALVLTAAGSTPAFAVNKNRDGTVSVTITRLGGINGANKKLAQIGVRAIAVPVVAGCKAPPPGVPGPSPSALRKNFVGPAVATARIDPKQIPAGKTLVLAATPAASGRVRVARLHAVAGPAPRCFWSRVPASGPGTVVCGPAQLPPGGGPPGGSSTTTTDTTTAPPTRTAPTQTATTGTGTTGTTGTGTTSTGPIQLPAPPRTRLIGCPPPPQCATSIVAPAKARREVEQARAVEIAKLRRALARARSAAGRRR